MVIDLRRRPWPTTRPLLGSISFSFLILVCCQLAASGQLVKQIKYRHNGHLLTDQHITMNMSSSQEVSIDLTFDRDSLQQSLGADYLELTFKTATLAPQFNILTTLGATPIALTKRDIIQRNYNYEAKLNLHANYIGHAELRPIKLVYTDKKLIARTENLSSSLPSLQVTIVQYEGTWGLVFAISVSVLMLISYVNLGAQIDEENLKLVVRKPKTLILGFLISALVMPLISWFVGLWLLKDQVLYRVGSFVFACSPAASATTLWTVMLNSDKELSVGLQVVSTLGALASMPALMYLVVDTTTPIRVPYARLFQSMFALLVAILVGWRLVGRFERAKTVSRRIFRPLIFAVLIFIILFSSILYWHIYQMFDWNITLASGLIMVATYATAGLLGHCIDCDLDRGVCIAISSAYKNSGIAFAVLLITFESPNTYIAYVPCLTQIVLTSASLYLTYFIVTLIGCVRRRRRHGGSLATEANTNTDTNEAEGAPKAAAAAGRARRGPSEDGEGDEFIALNVVDLEPTSPG